MIFQGRGGAAKTKTCLCCFDASIFYVSRSLVRMVSSFGDSSSISLLQCLPSRNLSSLRHARSILVVLLVEDSIQSLFERTHILRSYDFTATKIAGQIVRNDLRKPSAFVST